MTAEERARMLRHFVCTHYRPGIGAVIGPTSGEFFCEKCVAHEIRAAEDEALERAAQAVEEANIYVPGRHMTLGEQAELQHAAWRIRSLKSKPPEGK